MFKRKVLILPLIVLLAACSEKSPPTPTESTSNDSQPATRQSTASSLADVDVRLPYERFVLDNGLTVVVHEDRKAPIVAVNVWYHVGSKDEPAGKTGFAHLFEHLMFNGTENFDKDMFYPLEKVGGKDLNGTTWFDRTNYFETVPTPALEMALWLESDRMGHLLGAVNEEKLRNQIGVVQNEKRQGDAQPYGKMEYATLEGLFPPGHPYRHSTIGSMEDIGNASLEDVRGWFKQYYGTANSVLVLSGDIDAATAKPLVEKYFGDIPSGPPLTKMKAWVPTKTENQFEEMVDEVPAVRISRNWTVPNRTDRRMHLLRIAAQALGGGKNSDLYQALVYRNQLASDVDARIWDFELASMFEIEVNLKPGADRAKAEKILNETVAKFIKDGASADAIARAQTTIAARVIRNLENVGGRGGGKAAALAQGQLYAGEPDFVVKALHWITAAQPDDVNALAREWLSKGFYQLTAVPNRQYSTMASDVDRSKGLPPVNELPSLTFPGVKEATLSNGMKLVLAERHTVPVVQMALQFDAGYAADAGINAGTAKFTLAMLDEGTTTKSALDISAEAESLGAIISSDSNLDVSHVRLNALKPNLTASLQLFADVVTHPAFSADEIERLRQRWIADINSEKADFRQISRRVIYKINFGADHPYAASYGGSGTERSIANLSREDIVDFYQRWLRPDNATLFVVGDITLEEAKQALDKVIGQWHAPAVELGKKNIDVVANQPGGRVILIDLPGSPSTMVMGTQLLPPTGDDNTLVINAADAVLGGGFTSRLNMNIREDKGWAYWAYTASDNARGPRMWNMNSPIQTDKTKEGLVEMRKEMTEFVRSRPAQQDELDQVLDGYKNRLPGAFESSAAVLNNLMDDARFNRPYDYVTTLKQRYDAITLEQVNEQAAEHLHPDKINWLLIGDLAKIESDIRGLNIGPVEIWDKDGNPVMSEGGRGINSLQAP